MELIEAVKARKSIRGYKPTPVGRDIIAQILDIARWAPSGSNMQPWEFFVLGGDVLAKVKDALQQRFLAGAEPSPDFPMVSSVPEVYRERRVALVSALYPLLGFGREDREKRREWYLKMMRAFDAPNVIMVATEAEAGDSWALFNIGAVTQTIALVALEFGLGTCIEGALVQYPDVVREIAGIPATKKLAVGIAIGYPDWDLAVNQFRSSREPLENIVSWCGL
jgi:nitroreductase